jgi:hypothetical protein
VGLELALLGEGVRVLERGESPGLAARSRRKNSGSGRGSISSFFTSEGASRSTSQVMAGLEDQ